MIIDAENMILGRLAAFAAKKALLGEEISIINCEKAVVSGSRSNVLAIYREKIGKGVPLKGPHFPRMPDRLVKRAIKSMLPTKKARGRIALKKIKCYISVPNELRNKKTEEIKGANISKTRSLKYVAVGEISRLCGARI
jgi:large subunit ribosomal protein L13